ncbi:VOC family protein [Paenibacillus antri]|uniref:VOC family protein n=1 Tax=Paenibacillus antri TaxID=2582848 RepID=A0A5R9GDC5_9BACL|nr:VOC family protein [Paenibacillus antri]TLS51368.1 VOC family protein [Paenibacillus antri]
MIGKIASVSIYVEDQDKAVEFWTTQAGFVVRKDMPMGPSMRWIEVSPPNAGETVLVLYPKQAMPNAGELKPSMVFECSDIQGTYAEMKSNGVSFEGEPAKMGFGTFATFFDESGNRFGLRG